MMEEKGLTKEERQETRFIKKETMTCSKYLRRMEELEGMPIDEGSGEFSVTWHNRDYTCELPPMHPRCMCAVEYREEPE